MSIATIEQVHPGIRPASIEGLSETVPDFSGDVRALLASTSGITAVASNDDYELALRCAGDLKAMTKQAVDHFEPFRKAAHNLKDMILRRRDELTKPIDTEIERLSKLAIDYKQACERKRMQVEREAEEEKRRERAEEQRRIEEEALKNAELLKAQGNDAAAENALNQAAEALEELDAQPIIAMIPATAPMPSVPGSVAANRTNYAIDEESIDMRALCEAAVKNWQAFGHYLKPNTVTLGAAARAMKDRFNVPGVKMTASAGLAIKAAK